MAPSMFLGFATPASGGAEKKSRGVDADAVGEAELLRRRNAELELEAAAEERLCAQLADAEVEALELARAYHGRVQELAAGGRAVARS